MLSHAGDTGGLQILRRRVEHREEASHHQLVELVLGIVQMLGQLQRRNDGKVIRDLRIVENALIGLDPAVLEDLLRKPGKCVGFAKALQRVLHRGGVVLGKRSRIRARIGKDLVLLVERLGERQCHPCGEAEAAIRFTLQARQIEQEWRELRGRLGFFRGDAFPPTAGRYHCGGPRRVPDALRFALAVVILLEGRIEPSAGVLTGLGTEAAVHFPVVTRREGADLVFTLHEDRKRGRLHPAHRSEVEAALLRVEGGHRARSVDADQPVGFRATLGGVSERQQLPVGAQLGKSLADRLLRHRLQPQPLDWLLRARVLHEVAEDQLALASRVAGVDEGSDVLALDEPQQEVQAVLALLDWRQVEVRRDDRQARERPFALLDVVLLGQDELEQMSDRRRQHVFVALVVVALAREAAEGASDVARDRRFLGDDEFLGHAARKAADDKCKPQAGSTAFGQALPESPLACACVCARGSSSGVARSPR
ncbi:MAG: hypothetical protein K0R41_1166 [Geminicoccaceae bacterium]|nr:hypothetical protein [Geminicoccaceae bacterium]